MTKRDSRKLMSYLRKWQIRLGLQNWLIKLEIHEATELPRELFPPPEGAVGHLNPWDAQSSATIHVAEHAKEMSQQEITIHELVHLVLRGMARAHRRLEKYVAPEVWKMADEVFDDAQEVAIGNLVRALREGENGGE